MENKHTTHIILLTSGDLYNYLTKFCIKNNLLKVVLPIPEPVEFNQRGKESFPRYNSIEFIWFQFRLNELNGISHGFYFVENNPGDLEKVMKIYE